MILLLEDRHPLNVMWWNLLLTHIDKLRQLINDYHPSIGLGRKMAIPITAKQAEQACEIVRERIRKTVLGNPIDDFNEAVKLGNHEKVYSILSDTWFGIPESIECWRLDGFSELVDLLDNQPE